MTTATATEVQNNFGKFLKMAIEGQEVVILKNGTEVARLISRDRTVSFLTDSLVGVLKNDTGLDRESIRSERMKKYEGAG
ncbi:MAG: type II toxin-antitoxin system Phd/YefM family antitoxin [Clostridia bacterium]|nr:type II toxin-antitoxin system Phd/YefM family antitoxin [Clostridia bacterium]MBO7503402.1 type II toxin-antitoxin system Phd/YefM family antitoxin [Clostridia bacterium]MBO7659201.1 type II toxin-antitoxin system Phd/YefM family antitoxin [Clostridia bacterium]MBP5665687.1 type II toxin-antitoxin system Phd/YefM family antitoxin [Clostridia bacterium]MBP5765897.1 type II toxin-antitoxin system Phd/YefM family antitoxin [Clostridia bacterium]